MLYSSEKVRHFGGTYRLHRQGRTVSQENIERSKTASSVLRPLRWEKYAPVKRRAVSEPYAATVQESIPYVDIHAFILRRFQEFRPHNDEI
jgi:hypothetical protein